MQEWVSIYETCECDIEAPDIHRFLQVDGLSTRPPGFGASHILLLYQKTKHTFNAKIPSQYLRYKTRDPIQYSIAEYNL